MRNYCYKNEILLKCRGEILEHNYYDVRGANENDRVIGFLLIVVVLLSNFSQLPALVSIGSTSILSTPTWIGIGVILLFVCKFKIEINTNAKLFYQISFLFIILVAILSFVTGELLYNGDLFRAFLISIMVFSVGCISSQFICQRLINNMQIAYIMTLVVIGTNIYIQYFVGYDISSAVYGYGSKNSVSTMILAAIVFLVFGINRSFDNGFIKSLRFCLVVYFIFLLGLMKSRSSLIGLIVIIIAILMNHKIKQSYKVILVTTVILIVWYILNNDELYQLVVNDIIFAGRDPDSISSLSSGRTDLIEITIRRLSETPFVGLGNYYIDCFPISALANYGCIIGFVLIIISLYPFIFALRSLKNSPYLYDFCFTLAVLAGAFALNSLFEGLPPFGPGIKCYILWYFFGVLCNFDDCQTTEEYFLMY